jgi:hypothetical protein
MPEVTIELGSRRAAPALADGGELYPARSRLRNVLQLVLLACLWGPAVVLAEPPTHPGRGRGEEATGGARDRARAHFHAGVEHYRAQRYREALHEFRMSVAEMPSAEVWYDIARVHEALGEHGAAADHYELYLRDRVDAPDAEELRQRIARLRVLAAGARAAEPQRRPTVLRVDVPEQGATIMLDARPLGEAPFEELVEIEPGPHRLDVTHPDRLPFRARIDAQPGAVTAAYVELMPRAPRTRPRSARLWTWVSAVGSGGALLATGILGAAALDRDARGDPGAARDLALAADLALGGAIALGITAAVLYVAEGDGELVR